MFYLVIKDGIIRNWSSDFATAAVEATLIGGHLTETDEEPELIFTTSRQAVYQTQQSC
jgi:hypothetical protein